MMMVSSNAEVRTSNRSKPAPRQKSNDATPTAKGGDGEEDIAMRKIPPLAVELNYKPIADVSVAKR